MFGPSRPDFHVALKKAHGAQRLVKGGGVRALWTEQEATGLCHGAEQRTDNEYTSSLGPSRVAMPLNKLLNRFPISTFLKLG